MNKNEKIMHLKKTICKIGKIHDHTDCTIYTKEWSFKYQCSKTIKEHMKWKPENIKPVEIDIINARKNQQYSKERKAIYLETEILRRIKTLKKSETLSHINSLFTTTSTCSSRVVLPLVLDTDWTEYDYKSTFTYSIITENKKISLSNNSILFSENLNSGRTNSNRDNNVLLLIYYTQHVKLSLYLIRLFLLNIEKFRNAIRIIEAAEPNIIFYVTKRDMCEYYHSVKRIDFLICHEISPKNTNPDNEKNTLRLFGNPLGYTFINHILSILTLKQTKKLNIGRWSS